MGEIKHESELKLIIFLVFYILDVIFHSKSYTLQKTSIKLDMSLQSYGLLKGSQNNRKQKDLLPFFGSISKSILIVNCDSFCLIIPHIMKVYMYIVNWLLSCPMSPLLVEALILVVVLVGLLIGRVSTEKRIKSCLEYRDLAYDVWSIAGCLNSFNRSMINR